jgi:hypothetical protein
MTAVAFLAKLRADLLRTSMHGVAQSNRNERSPRQHCFLNHSPQLGITVYAIRHLLAHAVLIQQKTLAMLFHWMDWRISHNENARIAHYRMRLNMQL